MQQDHVFARLLWCARWGIVRVVVKVFDAFAVVRLSWGDNDLLVVYRWSMRVIWLLLMNVNLEGLPNRLLNACRLPSGDEDDGVTGGWWLAVRLIILGWWMPGWLVVIMVNE
eukprot:469159-Amphidinium_carterae.1